MIFVCENDWDLNRAMHDIRHGDKLYVPVPVTMSQGFKERIIRSQSNVLAPRRDGEGELVERNGRAWIKYVF